VAGKGTTDPPRRWGVGPGLTGTPMRSPPCPTMGPPPEWFWTFPGRPQLIVLFFRDHDPQGPTRNRNEKLSNGQAPPRPPHPPTVGWVFPVPVPPFSRLSPPTHRDRPDFPLPLPTPGPPRKMALQLPGSLTTRQSRGFPPAPNAFRVWPLAPRETLSGGPRVPPLLSPPFRGQPLVYCLLEGMGPCHFPMKNNPAKGNALNRSQACRVFCFSTPLFPWSPPPPPVPPPSADTSPVLFAGLGPPPPPPAANRTTNWASPGCLQIRPQRFAPITTGL